MATKHREYYTVDIPNQYGSNSYLACYTDCNYFTGGVDLTYEASEFIWRVYFGNDIDAIYISTNPNVSLSYRRNETESFTNVTLSNSIVTPNGTLYYYIVRNGVRFAPNAIPGFPQISTSRYCASGCTEAEAMQLAVYGAKHLWFTDTQEDPYVGYGDGALGGDTISVPGLPTLSAVNTGLVTLYNPSESELRNLADYLWTNWSTNPSDIVGAVKEVAQAIWRFISDPMKVVMGLSIVPSRGLQVSNVRYNVQAGAFLTPSVFMHRLTSQYYTVDCGTLQFNTLCGDTFLDYAPYSKFQIYLPFVGIVHVDANDFVGHTIGVKYNIDALSGACTSFITKDGSVMYTYSGNVSLNIPLSSDSWAQTLQTAIQIVASGVTQGIAGNTISALGGDEKDIIKHQSGVSQGIVNTAAKLASNPSMLSPSITRSGATAGSAGFMNILTPFVIREAVRYASTSGMSALKGYPLHAVKTIGTMIGYTEISNVHIEGIDATATEINEIERLLAEGVIL